MCERAASLQTMAYRRFELLNFNEANNDVARNYYGPHRRIRRNNDVAHRYYELWRVKGRNNDVAHHYYRPRCTMRRNNDAAHRYYELWRVKGEITMWRITITGRTAG